MTALRKEMFRVRLLEICAADFAARNLRGNRQHRNAIAMAVVKAVDEMQIARAATATAYRKAPGQERFRACGECRRFLMPDRHSGDVISWSNGISDSVERISGYSQNPLNTCCDERVDQHICNSLLSHTSGRVNKVVALRVTFKTDISQDVKLLSGYFECP